jgi:two-component system, sensor histidine kinase YesM
MITKYRLQTKLFFSYSIVLALIITSAMAIFYVYFKKDIEERLVLNLEQITHKTSNEIDANLEELDRIALYVVSNPYISEVFEDINNNNRTNFFSGDNEQTDKLVKTLLSITLPLNSITTRTSIYDIKGNYVSMGIPDSSKYITSKVTSSGYVDWYKSIPDKKNERTLIPPHDDFWSENDSTKFISVLRKIKKIETGNLYGIVEVQWPYKKLEELLNFDSLENVDAYLLNEKGQCIYPLNESNNNIVQFYSNIFKVNKSSQKVYNQFTGRMELVTYSQSKFSNWTLILVESEENLLPPLKIFYKTILFVGLGTTILTLVIIYLISTQLAMPIKQLRRAVKAVSLDNLSLELTHTEGNNEIAQLQEAFKAMILRLKKSMNESIQLRSQEMKAQLLALQSQMDPHFLHNMLSVISAAGQDAGIPLIMDMCHKLSNMLRYTTSYSKDNVTLKDELQHTVSYLDLMKLRYEERLSYNMYIDEEIVNIQVPKLILQPIAENCFQHGFKNVRPPWKIDIHAGKKDDCWFIQVCDNGSGFDDRTLEVLMNKAHEFLENFSTNLNDLKLGGLGLLNTYIRLKLLYNEKMIFNVEENSSRGTRITIGGIIE